MISVLRPNLMETRITKNIGKAPTAIGIKILFPQASSVTKPPLRLG